MCYGFRSSNLKCQIKRFNVQFNTFLLKSVLTTFYTNISVFFHILMCPIFLQNAELYLLRSLI